MICDLEELSLEEKENHELRLKLLMLEQAQSEALAAHVVLYKVLGLYKDSALACMAELARRRKNGEDFDYENFIEVEIKKLPKIPPIDFKTLQGLLSIKQLSTFVSRG